MPCRRLRRSGSRCPDPDLKWNAERGHHDFGEIDFSELFDVIAGHGYCNAERIERRTTAHTEGEWVREAAMAYAAKQQEAVA